MKVVQITDLHIDEMHEYPFDIDIRQNLRRILRAIAKSGAEHLVVTGDLCYRDGNPEIYQWIRQQLDGLGLPYDIIAGNHDDSVMMAEAFGRQALLTGEELFFTKKIGSHYCIFLDSSRGFHSEQQLNWLRRQLKQAGTEEVIIFMHHPPVEAGVPYMDNNHALQDAEQVQRIFAQYPGRVLVYTGHYHVEKTIVQGNMLLQITPSCFFQIDMRETEFKVDHHQIAYRVIDLSNKKVSSTLYYLRGSKKVV